MTLAAPLALLLQQSHVVVDSLPRKDIWDHSAVVSTIVLAFIGAITFGAVLYQAIQTKKAATAAADSVDAMNKQAGILERQTLVLVEGQRPRVVAVGYGDPNQTFIDKSARRINVKLENKGSTPAHELTYETWIEILPFPFVDFTESATYFRCSDEISLYPNTSPLIVNIPLQAEVSDDQLAKIRSWTIHVCVRVRVAYKDSFGSTEADFGYHVTPMGWAYLPKYNRTKRTDT